MNSKKLKNSKISPEVFPLKDSSAYIPIKRPHTNYYFRMMLFDFTLDYVRQYIHETSKIIEREQQKISQKIDEYDKENPLENREVRWDEDGVRLEDYTGFDYVEDEIMKYSEFTKILNSSMFTSLYSFMEHSLNDISTSEGIIRKKTLMPKDLEGRDYIQKSRKYIEKVLEIELSDLDTYWQKITDYQKIRNLIIHNGSNFWRDKNKSIVEQQSYKMITTFNGIQTDNHGNFYIYDTVILLDFCNLIEEFLNKIIDKIEV
jgi:hypothetical protein